MKQSKKFLSVLLVIAMVCTCCLSALAPAFATMADDVTYQEITDLSTLSAAEKYVLVCWRYFGGDNSDSTKGYVLHSTNDGNLRVDTADDYATVTGTLTEEAMWTITASGDGYAIQNVGNGKYLGTSMPASSDTAVSLSIVSGESNGCTNFCIGTSSSTIRYSGTSGTFSFNGSTPASQVTGTNACNITIYRVVTGTTEPEPTPAPEGTQILFCSDFQGDDAFATLTSIAAQAKKAGNNPEISAWCGDYVDGSVYADGSDTSQSTMKSRLANLKSAITGNWADIEFLLAQGNHDWSGWVADGTLASTGAHEYDDYIMYVINEDDFPWWQAGYMTYSDTDVCKAKVEQTAATLKTYLDAQIAADCTKPIFIYTHVPMHWTWRSTTRASWWSDNIYAATLFNVINNAGKDLDLVFIHGHNHGEYYGTYPENSCTEFFVAGDTIRIPNGTVASDGNYTTETLNFTYMNAGYIGKINTSYENPINTASVFTITDTQILMNRYTTTGEFYQEPKVIERFNYDAATASIYSADDVSGTRKEGKTERFAVATQNAEVTGYAWSSDSELISIADADKAEAAVTYMGGGDATITCTVSYNDIGGKPQTMTASYDVTIRAIPQVEGEVTYKAIADLNSFSSDKTYVLSCWRYFGNGSADSVKGYLVHSENNGDVNATTLDEYETLTYADGEIPAAAQWQIAKVDGGYTLRNVATGKYLGTAMPAASDTPVALTIVSGTSNGYLNYCIGTASTALRFSGSSNKFSFTGSTPASQVTGTNACNITIYEVVEPEVPEVPDDLQIITEPENYVGALNDNAQFHVEVNRSDVTYQWFYSNNSGKTWSKSTLPGFDTDTVTVALKAFRVGQMYRCVVVDSEGETVETQVVTLAIKAKLEIVSQPVDYTGEVGSTAQFTVEATGDGLTYRWMYSNDGRFWAASSLDGHDTATVSVAFKAYRDGQMYKCVVSDAYGNEVQTTVAAMHLQ